MAVALGLAMVAAACGSDHSTLAAGLDDDDTAGGVNQGDDLVDGDNDGDSTDGSDPTDVEPDPRPVDDDLVADVDTAQFIGLEFDEATALAEQQGLVWRIARQDDESFALTEDFNPNRLNFDVDDGLVTAVSNW